MHASYISFPIFPTWIFRRMHAAGYRPKQTPKQKHVDVSKYWITFTFQLPKKHAGITNEQIHSAIKLGNLVYVRRCKVRQNQKSIGVTIVVDCVGLKALGK